MGNPLATILTFSQWSLQEEISTYISDFLEVP